MGDKLRDETLDDVALWRIQCVKGKAGDGGVVVNTLYVTKKWERVQDVLDDHYDNPDPRKEDYYLVVTRLVAIDQEEFSLAKPTRMPKVYGKCTFCGLIKDDTYNLVCEECYGREG